MLWTYAHPSEQLSVRRCRRGRNIYGPLRRGGGGPPLAQAPALAMSIRGAQAPPAIGVSLVALIGCQDAVLGELPSAAVLGTPLTAQNLKVASDCDPRSASFRVEGLLGVEAAPELHVIGLETTALDGLPPATVQISRQAPLILALSSPRALSWIVEATPSAGLRRVVLVSDDGDVQVPPGIPVQHLPANAAGGLGCGTHYPPVTSSCNTFALLAGLEEVAGVPLSSFTGCRLGSRFGIVDPRPPRWDVLTAPSGVALSADERTASAAATVGEIAELRGTTALSVGRWYFEVEVLAEPSEPSERQLAIGLAPSHSDPAAFAGDGWILGYALLGQLRRNPDFEEELAPGPPVHTGDRVGLAIDLDRDRVWISVNDAWFPGPPQDHPGVRAGTYAGVLPLYPTIVLGAGAVLALRVEPERGVPGFQALSEVD